MKKWVAFLLLLGSILAACTYQVPTPSQAEIIFMAAQTVASNQDVSYIQPSGEINNGIQHSPTLTLIPPAEILTPVSQVSVNIATQIAIPKQSPKVSRIYGLAVMDNGSLLVTVEFSPLPKGAFSAELGQDPLQCNTLAENPHRIYCHGFVSRFDQIQTFRLYREGKIDPVFFSDLWVPAIPQAKILPSPEKILMETQDSTPTPTSIQYNPELTP